MKNRPCYRKVTLICGGCKRRFYARDEQGKPRNGAATVRGLMEAGVPQNCPDCGRPWKGTVPKSKPRPRYANY